MVGIVIECVNKEWFVEIGHIIMVILAKAIISLPVTWQENWYIFKP